MAINTTMKIMSRKSLVMYYSLNGNTKLVAKSIADAIGADLQPITPEKDIAPAGFLKYIQGVWQVMRKTKPQLQSLEFPPQLYQVIFIGTPVWAGTFAPAINALIGDDTFADKKIALFCCHGGKPGNVFDNLKERLANNEIIGTVDFENPLKTNREEAEKKAADWAGLMLECLEDEEREKEHVQEDEFARAPE